MHEIVDGNNMPLGIMDSASILRQEILHRAVALVVRSKTGHTLLKKNENHLWDLPFQDLLPIGKSTREYAQNLLAVGTGMHSTRLYPLGICPPEKQIRAFTTLFEIRPAKGWLNQTGHDADNFILLDYGELKHLGREFTDNFSPLLQSSLRRGFLRPR
ncbi:MAG: NUDIX hydrolase [Desulfovibrio sp.]|nr:NUDIX hydrolase [Desulfovibrio sp.]